MPYEALLSALILVTSLLVLFDAKGLGARKGGLGGGQLDMGYVSWFVTCLLLWIIAFPCYLVVRPRLVWARARRDARTPLVPTAPVQYAQSYSREYAQAYGLPWTEPFVQAGPAGPAPAAEASSSRGIQLAGLAAVVVAIALAVPAIAKFERTNSAAYGTPVAAASTPARSAALDATLSQITLRSTDFHGGYSVRLAADGTQLAGHATLDNCGFGFTTEDARVARREVYVIDTHGQDGGIDNEVVAYRSTADAALALRQWTDAAKHCQRTPFASASVGGSVVTERIVSNEVNASALPVPSNVVTVEDVTPMKSATLHLVAVLQLHGRLLDVVYVRLLTPPTSRAIDLIKGIASGTGRRLANQ